MPLDGLFTILDDSLIVFFPRVEAHNWTAGYNDARDCGPLAMGYRSKGECIMKFCDGLEVERNLKYKGSGLVFVTYNII